MVQLSPTAQLRRFNRSFTRQIGVLDESFMSSGLPIAAARLLFEIGLDQTGDGVTIRELRSKIGLDAGYVSRLLRQLEARALLDVSDDKADGRRRVVRLNQLGEQEWLALDRRSDELAASLIEPLSPEQRAELCAALATAERLVHRARIRIEIVDPNDDAARAAMDAYFVELDRRFEGGFDAVGAFDDDGGIFDAPTGRFVVVFDGDRPVGCGGVQRLDDEVAEVKRMWLHSNLRGLGLGRDLLARLESEATTLGYSAVALDTNAVLTQAIALYESAGYEATTRYNDNPYAHHWFRKLLR